MAFIPSLLIEKKRRGEELAGVEMENLFLGFLGGDVPDYQMSAFLMAVHFKGLCPEELNALLDLMIHSGEVLDLSWLEGPKVDKHSTGGVGDKTSLVLAPLAAELGVQVPMMAGRGLGHTGGTLDKLEAIPGFRTQLRLDEFRSVLSEIGVAMIGQTEEIAPLDRRLYALRDATATVPSIPLIAASIMSKKLAEGIQGLVLDVKTGKGAFLPAMEDSRELARTMVAMGESRGVRTTALISGMDAPLGRAVGNGLETIEAMSCLAGNGPSDLADLSTALVGEMLFLGGVEASPEAGSIRAREALNQGVGLERMARLVELQGGDPRNVMEPERLPRAPEIATLQAKEPGFVGEISPVPLGHGVIGLGGGRRKMGDPVDLRVGFVLDVARGDRVEAGDALGEVHAADKDGLALGLATLAGAIRLVPENAPSGPGLILERIGDSG